MRLPSRIPVCSDEFAFLSLLLLGFIPGFQIRKELTVT